MVVGEILGKLDKVDVRMLFAVLVHLSARLVKARHMIDDKRIGLYNQIGHQRDHGKLGLIDLYLMLEMIDLYYGRYVYITYNDDGTYTTAITSCDYIHGKGHMHSVNKLHAKVASLYNLGN